MVEKKIVIVGGGLAGLSAAYTLKKAGIRAEIYEATQYAGGRCRNDYTDGYEFYVGAGSTEPQWKTTFQYLEELNILDKVLPQAGEAGLGFYTKGKLRVLHLGGSKIKMLGSVLKFAATAMPFSVYTQGMKFLKLLGEYRKKINFETGDFTALEEVSNMSVGEFARKNGLEALDEYILHPLLAMMVCGSDEDIAMGHIILLFSLMEGMCSMDGGMGVISEALFAQVEDRVHFNTPVREVVIEDGKTTGIKTDDGFIAADHVIVALDAVATRKIIPNLPKEMDDALATCNYSTTLYYEFGLEKPIESIKHSFVMIPKSTNTILNCVSDGVSNDEKPIILTHTRGEYQEELLSMPKEERDARVIAALREIVPEFPENPKITKMYCWDRAVNLEGPGQFEAINKLKAEHMHDVEGLHLSGDYFFLIACTEGSMKAGKDAAEYVIEQLK